MFVVWQDASRFELRSKVSTWIFGIAWHKALKALERQKREGPPLPAPAEIARPDDGASALEIREWLGHALDRLSPDQRLVVELTFFAGCSYQEIADDRGLPRQHGEDPNVSCASSPARHPGVARCGGPGEDSMTNKATTGDLERKALELLPWYVNGTLEGEERELVGRQVLASLTCRKELERLRHLQQLIQRDDAEAAATDREFERLMARIQASDAPTRPHATLRRRGFGWFPFAIAATVVGAVAASLWWGTLPPSAPSGPYETLTSSQPAVGTPCACGSCSRPASTNRNSVSCWRVTA